MKIGLTSGILGCAAAAVVCLTMGCESNDTTAQWQPGQAPYFNGETQEWWHFKFVYHPQDEVYFQPYTGQYYWFADGAWRSGTELPLGRAISSVDAKIVKSTTDLPFLHHTANANWHPNPNGMPANQDAQKAGQGSFALLNTSKGAKTANQRSAKTPGVTVFRPSDNQYATAPTNNGRN